MSKKTFGDVLIGEVMRSISPGIVLGALIVAATSASFRVDAQTWNLASAPITNWSSVASSADGSKLVAAASPGFVYISTNGGSSWQPTSAPAGDWLSVCSSAGGEILAATGIGATYISNDSGLTWAYTNSPGGSLVSCSADGAKMFVIAGWQLFASTNYGFAWKDLSPPVIPVGFRFASIASSADGNESIVLSGCCGGVGYDTHPSLWAGWNPSSASGELGSGWSASVVSSADGNMLAAYLNSVDSPPGGRLYTSTDAGSNWTTTLVTATNLTSITSSADGTQLAAVATGETTYMSTNGGAVWSTVSVPTANWVSVASSADGNKMVAAANGGGIYTWQSQAKASLNINPTDSGVVLSWTVPSVNFELQQASSLTVSNWTRVVQAPTLNLSNLQYQLNVPQGSGSWFYRLVSR